jgi:phospholipid/cholesterol/gamma-HCH transport system substrate-binding protein
MYVFSNKNLLETIVGAFVLVGAVILFYKAYDKSNVKTTSGYKLNASFESVEGVVEGSDVLIGGIKIGVVDKLSIDPKTYRANASVIIEDKITLPTDSSIIVASSGLIGNKYLAISPGGSEDVLKEGDKFEYTQSSVNFETLLGKYIFKGEDKKEEEKKKK